MNNRSGLVLIREIEELIASGVGWEDIAVILKFTHPSQKRFIRELVLKRGKKVAA